MRRHPFKRKRPDSITRTNAMQQQHSKRRRTKNPEHQLHIKRAINGEVLETASFKGNCSATEIIDMIYHIVEPPPKGSYWRVLTSDGCLLKDDFTVDGDIDCKIVAVAMPPSRRRPGSIQKMIEMGKMSVEQISIWHSYRSLQINNFYIEETPANRVLPYCLKKLNLDFTAIGQKDFEHIWNGISSCPMNVHKLEGLGFYNFNHSLVRVKLPAGLNELSLSGNFDQSLVNVEFPEKLEKLRLHDRCNQSLADVVFPKGLVTLCLRDGLNQNLADLRFPKMLEGLHLGEAFDYSLIEVIFPERLKMLDLRQIWEHSADRHSLVGVKFPASLQILRLPDTLNCNLQKVKFPEGLKELSFGEDFNQSLVNITLPTSLKALRLGVDFNQSMDGVILPEGLNKLYFNHRFNQHLDNIGFPVNLTHLECGACFNSKLILPDTLEDFTFYAPPHLLRDMNWPRSMRRLEVNEDYDVPQDLKEKLKQLAIAIETIEERSKKWLIARRTEAIVMW